MLLLALFGLLIYGVVSWAIMEARIHEIRKAQRSLRNLDHRLNNILKRGY